MPSASLLTKTSDQVVSSGSPGNIYVTWQTETKFLDADVDFFDSGVSTINLNIPAALSGVPYEVFMWLEDTSEATFPNGHYAGLQVTGSGTHASDAFFGIQREAGRFARGFRSGRVVADADGADWVARVREFDSATITARAARCRLGVISGEPALTGLAAASGDVVIAASTEATIAPTATFDAGGGVYNSGSGVWTAPTGASLVVPSITGLDNTLLDATALRYKLFKNGTEIAAYRHGGSRRCPGPGCFGLLDVSPGDELLYKLDNALGSDRTLTVQASMEFF